MDDKGKQTYKMELSREQVEWVVNQEIVQSTMNEKVDKLQRYLEWREEIICDIADNIGGTFHSKHI